MFTPADLNLGPKHRFSTAFHHMTYRTEDGSAELRVWNSRDGKVPFAMTLPESRKAASRVDHDDEVYDPGHVPALGDWVIVDMDWTAARLAAERTADRWFTDPVFGPLAREKYGNRSRMANELTGAFMDIPGSPCLLEVTEELRARWAQTGKGAAA